MGKNYRFHVCFVSTKEIDSHEHYQVIKKAFMEIVEKHAAKAVFYPSKVQPYVIQGKEGFLHGRSPDNCPLVLLPRNPEDF